MKDFGTRLRQARRGSGMSQAELGGGRFSASYISHLEAGRRHAGSDVLEYLADRLDMTVTELAGRSSVKREEVDRDARIAVSSLETDEAIRFGEYDRAVKLTQAAARLAGDSGRVDVWWSSTHQLGQAYLRLEKYEEAEATAIQLGRHELATDSATLRAEAATLASKAARAAGRLDAAGSHAERAVEAAELLPPGASQLTGALISQLAALVERGLVEQVGPVVARLERARVDLPSPQTAGLAAWALGNYRFMVGDIGAGLAEHAQAARALRPESDLLTWARFSKASAAWRVAAGVTEGVDALIEAAEQALALVGGNDDRAELAVTKAAMHNLRGESEAASALMDQLLGCAASMVPNTKAEAYEVRAQAHHRAGRIEQAVVDIECAAMAFEGAGATERALHCWRRLAQRFVGTPTASDQSLTADDESAS